jgi:hypothetical protein
MIIDCDCCTMRDVACDDCVVPFLTATSDLSDSETSALGVLARSGLVPPLRIALAGSEHGACGHGRGA